MGMGKGKHGPRYTVKGRPRHYVERDSKGRFKKWILKSRSHKTDRVWKAPKGRKPGYGHRKDYARYRKKKKKK
jgi:hypothetical protein